MSSARCRSGSVQARTVSGRATSSSTATTASDGAHWSASVPNGRLAPTTRNTKIVTTSARVRDAIFSSSSWWECIARPSISMLPTMSPARNAPR